MELTRILRKPLDCYEMELERTKLTVCQCAILRRQPSQILTWGQISLICKGSPRSRHLSTRWPSIHGYDYQPLDVASQSSTSVQVIT